jgi:hypothetical protein
MSGCKHKRRLTFGRTIPFILLCDLNASIDGRISGQFGYPEGIEPLGSCKMMLLRGFGLAGTANMINTLVGDEPRQPEYRHVGSEENYAAIDNKPSLQASRATRSVIVCEMIRVIFEK